MFALIKNDNDWNTQAVAWISQWNCAEISLKLCNCLVNFLFSALSSQHTRVLDSLQNTLAHYSACLKKACMIIPFPLGSPERETPLRSQIFTEASVLQPEGRFQTNAVSLMTSIFTVTADSLRLNLEMISRMRAVLSEKWVCALNTMGVCSLCCL